jgi:hypothetical protein
MLTGNFREASASEIPFPEDDAEALRVLLLIAHRHDKVPTEPMSVDTLTNIADLCDKYNTLGLVKRYTDRWVKDCRFPNPFEHVANSEQLLRVYWVFRYEKEFKETMQTLWKHVSFSEDGEALIYERLYPEDRMPPGVMGKVLSILGYVAHAYSIQSYLQKHGNLRSSKSLRRLLFYGETSRANTATSPTKSTISTSWESWCLYCET